MGGGRPSPGQVPGGSPRKAVGALRPGRLPHRTGSAFDWASLEAVVPHPAQLGGGVFREVRVSPSGVWEGGGVLPRALGSSHSGLSCRFTPSRPTFLCLPQPVLICKPIVAPFLPSPPCHPCSWLFPAPPGEGIWALQACPRTPEMHRKSRTGETLWSHRASVSSSVKWE